MINQILIEAPQNSHFDYGKYYSSEGVAYNFLFEPRPIPTNQIDKIDYNLRVLVSFLQLHKFSVLNFGSQTTIKDDEFRNLYNKLKRDEKIIKAKGLELTALDGFLTVYKNPRYRITYPSYEAFARDFYKNMRYNYIVFGGEGHSKDMLLGQENHFDNNFTYEETGEVAKFMIYFDAGECEFASSTWRKYTEILANLLKNKENRVL